MNTNPRVSGKTLSMVLLGGLIIVAALVSWSRYESRLSASITIQVAPSVSHITINGETAQDGLNKVHPGAQQVAVSLTGFTTTKQTVSVSKGQDQYVGIVLLPDSATTADWYQTHLSDQQLSQTITGKTADNVGQQLIQKAPIIQHLPFIGPGMEYEISYGNQSGINTDQPIIYIQSPTTQGQQDALLWIKNQGYNPSSLDIVYNNQPVE